MDFTDFTGEAQHRLELGTQGAAVASIRSVLNTLGERLHEGEATDVAGALPREIDRYLADVEHGQRFDFDEFVERVAERADLDRDEAVYHSKAIVALLDDAVPGGGLDTTRESLPEEFSELFEFAESDTPPWEAEAEAGN